MSAHELPGEVGAEPVFLREGRTIYLRCVNDDGVHMGDLRIAECAMDGYAATLTRAANAGMALFKDTNVEKGLRKLLDES